MARCISTPHCLVWIFFLPTNEEQLSALGKRIATLWRSETESDSDTL